MIQKMLISNWFKTAKYLNTKLYKLHLNLHMVSRQRKNKQKGLSLVLNTKKRHIKNKKKKKNRDSDESNESNDESIE